MLSIDSDYLGPVVHENPLKIPLRDPFALLGYSGSPIDFAGYAGTLGTPVHMLCVSELLHVKRVCPLADYILGTVGTVSHSESQSEVQFLKNDEIKHHACHGFELPAALRCLNPQFVCAHNAWLVYLTHNDVPAIWLRGSNTPKNRWLVGPTAESWVDEYLERVAICAADNLPFACV